MKTWIIHNPGAGSAEQWPALRELLRVFGEHEIRETQNPGDARKLAADATRANIDRVIGAGGDGTMNEVINGVMDASADRDIRRPRVGVIPLGTGNDLPRTLGIPLEPAKAIPVLAADQCRKLDLVRAKWNESEQHLINVAAGGFTGQMNEALTDELKARWGPLAYVRGAVKVIPDLTQYHTTIRFDGEAKQDVKALNIIVANGRTAGGGTVVAPLADPQDGLLDIVIVHMGTTAQLAGVAARVLAGDYTNSDIVTHRTAKRVEIDSTPGMWFNIDGELITNDPIVLSIVASALDVIVGPTYGLQGATEDSK